MKNKLLSYITGAIVLVILFFIVKSTFNQTGIDQMKAGFKEITKYRNDNNTGPIQRIYVVTVKDSIWSEMSDYGNLMPHTKYGNTKVYFFMEHTSVPKTLQPGEVNFDPQLNKNCIALYEKSAMSLVAFNKHPLK
ncbi:hypothetical protein EZJ43_08800 [Pedobacter changchengzhani]|uniref:Uncharacterized protein n=1 Tax=Pedobacter changchengzhani TaxID=2529274 RepID=A0A4R5MND0_9SPHI|nr:hypothetical protein [Pedobacter changchengzhani]TDG36599.1 hypothetical protein EZJ43_08800 [Pedobacter changchengzhani]